jgi:hypothetical protein
MTEKRREINGEIERALEILDSTLIEDQRHAEDEAELDTAVRKLIHLLPETPPSKDFSNRVMIAVRCAPLPAGRRRLGAPASPTSPTSRTSRLIGAMAAAAAVLAISAALWATGFEQFIVARISLAIIQRGLSAVRFVSLMLPAWRWIVVTMGAVIEAMTSIQMLSAVLIMMALTVLPFMGLKHLLSPSSKESIKW